ncbi:DinB family protein [Paenibacillus rhizophilus]|uniref:Damage-inducible protein DinB n=1 Tax=Paenibacillus rhizophilus TaxID=1850366 RepID=A0A3N9PAK2_9BACL|nr:DinB family protein [Paenibacillus rhizophilus]RQW12869.1 damage-inducible protein DinB [Paenibacillus rhizophilus]
MSAPDSVQKEYFRRLFRHASWADKRIITALRQRNRIPEKPLALLGHILAAEKVWLMRINGTDGQTVKLWHPPTGLEECAALAEENAAGYGELLDMLDDSGLNAAVAYRNSTGKAYNTSVSDILTHVALHGSYHRGQIASFLRLEGLEPVNTDYITFVRDKDV